MISNEEEITSGKKAEFSHYLKDGFISDGVIETSTGIDVGRNTNINTINYSNSINKQSEDENYRVVIKTNSFDTSLRINAEYDTIKHYGNVKEVNIAKVAQSSYHEFGTVSGNINLAYGRVVLEDNSSVSNVVLKEIDNVTPTFENCKITVNENTKVENIISAGFDAYVINNGNKNVHCVNNNSNKPFIKDGIPTDDYYATDGSSITLLSDLMLSRVNSWKMFDYSITLDLNGFTLTTLDFYNSLNIGLVDDKETSINTTIKNGTLNIRPSRSDSSIIVYANSSLTLENVTMIKDENSNYDQITTAIFPRGNAAAIHVNNSKILGYQVGIATNAAQKNGNYSYSQNVLITINSSSITSTSCGVWINVPGNLEIDNSFIEGDSQGAFVRVGNALISNSTISAKLSGEGDATLDYETVGEWGSGNFNVTCGALVVGDYNSSYSENASCTLKSTKVVSSNNTWARALIVLAQDTTHTTDLNYDNLCNIDSSKYYIYSDSTLENGTIRVNGKIINK